MKNLYKILGVDPSATKAEIRAAFRRKALDLHPDRLPHATEAVRRSAEEAFKEANEAYQVLGKEEKRKIYHTEWVRSSMPPKPVVVPSVIVFNDVLPGEKRTGSFVIRNNGGAYDSIWFSDPDSWVKVTDYASLESEDELPLRVDIVASGTSWGRHYTESIDVRLDGVSAAVKVQLHTKPAPAPKSTRPVPATAQPSGSGDWLALLGIAAVVAVFVMIFVTNLPENTNSPVNYNRPVVNQYPIGSNNRSNQPGFGPNQPGFGINQPGIGGIQPGVGGYQPGIGGYQPGIGGIQPGIGGYQPGLGGYQPGLGGSQPSFGGNQPNFGGTQPSFGGRQPSFGGSPASRPGSSGFRSGSSGSRSGSSGFGSGSSGFGSGSTGFGFGR